MQKWPVRWKGKAVGKKRMYSRIVFSSWQRQSTGFWRTVKGLEQKKDCCSFTSQSLEQTLQDILRHLASKDAGFVLELFPEEDLVRMGNDVIKHGLRQQSPLFHALMIMRFGGVQWLEHKTQA